MKEVLRHFSVLCEAHLKTGHLTSSVEEELLGVVTGPSYTAQNVLDT